MMLSGYLIFNAIMFSISIFGILLNHQNLLSLLIHIALMLLTISSNFIIYAKLWNDLYGQIWVLFILSIIAVKFSMILMILLKIFKIANSIEVEEKHLNNLRIE